MHGGEMKINQVLWVIDNKTHSVIPVKIIEKVTKETSEGLKVEFIIQTVSGKKANLGQVDGLHFQSLDESRKYLIDSATKLVDNIVEKARNTSLRLGADLVQGDLSDNIIPLEPVDDFITLQDGTLAKVRIKI